MLNVSVHPSVEGRLARLDDAWERDLLHRLPFPLAYALNRVRQEEVPWDVLLKDTLNALVQYLALLGASEYLVGGEAPDYNVNDKMQKLAGPMSEGEWWKVARACALRKPGKPALPELAAAVQRLERDKELRVSLQWDRYGIHSQRLPPVQALVFARNRLYAHGVTPEASEKMQASAQIRQVFRLVLDELQGLRSYDLCVPLPEGDTRHHYLLKGIEGFPVVPTPAGIAEDQAFLRLPTSRVLGLHPLTLGGPPQKVTIGSLLDETAELYLLNTIQRGKATSVPVFRGVAGSQSKRPDLSESFDTLLNGKNVWATRQDIQLDRVLQYAAYKSRDSLDYFEWNNLYDPFRYVERPAVEGLIRQFIAGDESRLLFIAGESGSGKTATSMHMAHDLLNRNVPVCVVRAVEMPSRVGGGEHRLAAWFCALHGYAGTFGEILVRAAAGEAGRFVIIIDGLNEFLAAGRDLDGLWRSINGLVEAHATHASLKVILTTRVEGEALNIYFPHYRPPEFADHGLFYLVDGKPWFLMPGFTPEEALSALQRYGLDAETAAQVQRTHGEALSAPLLTTRCAQLVRGGVPLKAVTRYGVTVRLVKYLLGRDKALRKTLDRLVAVLAKSKTLEMTFEGIERRDQALATTLQADNYQVLHRLRELGLVALQRRVNEGGNLTTYVALGDDTLFEGLFLQCHRRTLRSITWFMTALLGLPVLVVLGGMVVIVGIGTYFLPHNAKAEVDELFTQALASASPEALRELQKKALALAAETAEWVGRQALYESLAVFCHGLALVLVFFAMMLIMTFQSKRYLFRVRFDARARYYAATCCRRFTKYLILAAGITLLVFATIVLPALGKVCSLTFVGPRVALTHFAPLFIVVGIGLLLLLVFSQLLAFRMVRRCGSEHLKAYWYSKTAVRHACRTATRISVVVPVGICVFLSLASVPPMTTACALEGLKPSPGISSSLAARWQEVDTEVKELYGTGLPKGLVPDFGGAVFVNITRPLITAEQGRWAASLGLPVVTEGLVLVWGFLGVVALIARHAYPEHWGAGPSEHTA